MISKRARKLQSLCADASTPNSDADRLIAISRAANRGDLGRPTRSYMVDQLREIESRSADPAITLRIAEIRDRFSHNKGVKERRLERRARTKIETVNDSIVGPGTIEAAGPVPAEPAPRNPEPPKLDGYVPGKISQRDCVSRIRAAGLLVSPSHEACSERFNGKILRAALMLDPQAPIPAEVLGDLWLSFLHEPLFDVDGQKILCNAVVGYANHRHIGLPRPGTGADFSTVSLQRELERRCL